VHWVDAGQALTVGADLAVVEESCSALMAMASRTGPGCGPQTKIELLDSEAWMKPLHGLQSDGEARVLQDLSGDPLPALTACWRHLGAAGDRDQSGRKRHLGGFRCEVAINL